MKAGFELAIGKVGAPCTATVEGNKRSFFASLQAQKTETLDCAAGFGQGRYFRVFMSHSADTEALVSGGSFWQKGEEYRLVRIETVCFGGEALYRQGVCMWVGGSGGSLVAMIVSLLHCVCF